MQRWLVAIDDTPASTHAFNYAIGYMRRDIDELYLLHAMESPVAAFIGYATVTLIEGLQRAERERTMKILTHFGRLAKNAGVTYKLLQGSSASAGKLLCRAVKEFNISQVVIGRREMGTVHRFFSGSVSKYVVENADCNVIVVKVPIGGEEEHSDLQRVIAAEESERLWREEYDEATAEVHTPLSATIEAEEAERSRRLQEGEGLLQPKLDKLFSIYRFKEELESAVADSTKEKEEELKKKRKEIREKKEEIKERKGEIKEKKEDIKEKKEDIRDTKEEAREKASEPSRIAQAAKQSQETTQRATQQLKSKPIKIEKKSGSHQSRETQERKVE